MVKQKKKKSQSIARNYKHLHYQTQQENLSHQIFPEEGKKKEEKTHMNALKKITVNRIKEIRSCWRLNG